jgi:hypothetical protein
MRNEAFMRDRSTLRLRLLAGGVALATTISFGVWSAPPAGAAAARNDDATAASTDHPLSAKPDDIPGRGLLCDFDHTSWCVGVDPNSVVITTIELIAALKVIFDWIFKGESPDGEPEDQGKDDGEYKGKHRKPDGLCLTQAGGDVIWGKCGTKSGTSVYNSAEWVVVAANNGGFGFANVYWLVKGKTLYLTEPPKIAAGHRLRLHALFGGAGGQALQEWKFFSIGANGQLIKEALKPGEIVRL